LDRLQPIRAALGIAVAVCLANIITAGEPRPQERSRMETYDDLLLRVERMAPGFGGMFIEQDGRLVVYLLDTSQLPSVRSAIEAVFGPDRIPAAGMRAIQGQYTISQLKMFSERARALLEIRGVTLVDLNEAKNRVTVGIEDASRTQAVERAISSLKIPRAAMDLHVTGPIKPVAQKPWPL
jgi:hypothetical protein